MNYPTELPDSLISNVRRAYKALPQDRAASTIPFSLLTTHSHFKRFNVEWQMMQAVKGREASRFDTQPHRIYLGLLKEYAARGCITLDGVDYYP
jgi:hypothetical protein